MISNNETAVVYRYLWIVVAVCLACLFTSLGDSRFWDQDEGFFASAAAAMYASADWIVPSFNGEMFGHKPPWMYWMMMVGYSLFDVFVDDGGVKLDRDKKSIAYSLTYRDDSRTLQSAEVDAAHSKVLEALQAALPAKLRLNNNAVAKPSMNCPPTEHTAYTNVCQTELTQRSSDQALM